MTKRKLSYEITQAEIDSFSSISVRMDNIEKTIAEAKADPATSEAFWTAAFNHKDKISAELADWWNKLKARLGVSLDAARVDPNAGCLFELIGDDGKVDTVSFIDPSLVAFEK